MKQEFSALYNLMAGQQNVAFMHIFGQVHKEMMDWFIANKPELAQEWLDKLESIRWKNYLTKAEAEKIVAGMEPKAPWSRDQWKQAMMEHSFDTEHEPYYNHCALYATMNMLMSDSGDTLAKYVEKDNLFKVVHDLSVDKLIDKDGVFSIRAYFGL